MIEGSEAKNTTEDIVGFRPSWSQRGEKYGRECRRPAEIRDKIREVLLLKNEKDENEISRPTEELLSAPKPAEMLWKPGRKYDDPRQRLEVFFRPWALSGLESRKGNGWKRQRKSSR